MPLWQYLEQPFSERNPLYFFDREGRWTQSMPEFRRLLEEPSWVTLMPTEPGSPIIFAIGKTGSGIGMHQHQVCRSAVPFAPLCAYLMVRCVDFPSLKDAWNEVLVGAKRWCATRQSFLFPNHIWAPPYMSTNSYMYRTLYPGDPGGIPPSAAYNPTVPHISWLQDVYPTVRLDPTARPLECIQRAGDVVYVPAGWYHATVNLGDTIAVAQRRSA